jgi:DeoR family fructose operon transcriptional repressor
MVMSSNIATEERLSWLAAHLEKHGSIQLGEASESLGVSEMTIRRDLVNLEGMGIARRVRGGAVAAGHVDFQARKSVRAAAKAKIAAKLRPLVPATGAIGIDSSSTALRLAAVLDRAHSLSVVTNGPDAFTTLQGREGITPVLTGGVLSSDGGSLIGPQARKAAGDLLLSRLFLSAAALDPALGSSETSVEDAELKRAMLAVSSDVVVAVDSSKLDTRALALCVHWDQVTTLVTELDPRSPKLDAYRGKADIL